MNENLEAHQPETPAPQKTKIPKTAWYIGGGCLILLCCIAVVALGIAGYFYFAKGGAIASATPSSALMYVSVDFLQSQSNQFNEIVPIIQEITDGDKQSLVDTLEDEFQNSLGLSFKEEVIPWMGQHGAMVITDGDIMSEEFEFMLIMEARNKKSADEFIEKLVNALKDKSNMDFQEKKVDGVTFYIHKAGYGKYNDVVVARNKSLVYLANAEAPVLSSINLKAADSLARSKKYQQTMAALPSGSMASFYISQEVIEVFLAELSDELNAPQTNQLDNNISGAGVSMSLVDEGLRFDIALAYDESKLNDFQKKMLKAKYMEPKSPAMLPEDTFFFVGMNSAMPLAERMQDGNPAYTQDFKESLEMLERETNVNIQQLFELLTGEFSVAFSPSTQGVIATEGDLPIGFTLLAETNDEDGFNNWMKSLFAAAEKNYITVKVTDMEIGKYTLQQASIEGAGDVMLYGAENGYIILGTSKDILEKGLSGKKTLADNDIYRKTWKAFPTSSVPYMYINVTEFMDIVNQVPYSEFANLSKIPVVAATLNQTSGYATSSTVILFIETK